MEEKRNILFDIKDHIGVIRLNEPLPRPEFVPLSTIQGWIRDNHLKGLVITGTGRHFSSGADIEKLFSEDFTNNMEEEMNMGKHLLSFLAYLDIPVFAAIKGVCFGGGLEIALACHIRIASPNALFAFPEVNQKVIPGMGGTVMVQEHISRVNTFKMLLGGDMVNSAEALDMKLIDAIERDPEEYSVGLLKRMTEDRPLPVIRAIVKAIHNVTLLSREDALKEETRMFCELAREEGLKRRSSE